MRHKSSLCKSHATGSMQVLVPLKVSSSPYLNKFFTCHRPLICLLALSFVKLLWFKGKNSMECFPGDNADVNKPHRHTETIKSIKSWTHKKTSNKTQLFINIHAQAHTLIFQTVKFIHFINIHFFTQYCCTYLFYLSIYV